MDEDAGGLIWHFLILKKESPSAGGGVRGAAPSTEKQVSNLWRNYLVMTLCPKKMVRDRVINF